MPRVAFDRSSEDAESHLPTEGDTPTLRIPTQALGYRATPEMETINFEGSTRTGLETSNMVASSRVCFVDRERLRDRIERCAHRPITLIVAPPGYGKSVALTQFLAGRVEWIRYNVRPDHEGILGFLRGFAEALVSVAPHARAGVSEAATTGLRANTPAAALAQWLGDHLAAYSGIVAIDDLHICQNDVLCIETLTRLIEGTKSRITWILASRSSLHLPIAQWVAQGDAS